MQSQLMSPSEAPRKVEGTNGLGQNHQFFNHKIIKVLGFMVWVSQEQPAAAGSSWEQSGATSGSQQQLAEESQRQPVAASGTGSPLF